MFVNPYATTVGKTLSSDVSANNLKQALAARVQFIQQQANGTYLVMPNHMVRQFHHPLAIQGFRQGDVSWCADVSAYAREVNEGEYVIRDKGLYALQVMRVGLTQSMETSHNLYYSLPEAVVGTYVDLMTNSLTLAYNLNADEIIALRACSGWLYYSMLQNTESASAEDRDLYMMRLKKATALPMSMLDRYIPQDFFYKDVEDFCNDLKEKIDSPVIRSLTPGVLFTCLSKNLKSTMLIGIPANEVICMSVEHLPTWVSLLTVCLTEQSFKKTGLGKIVERQFNRDKNAKTSLVTAVNAAVNTFA